jgi:hypothetical protein
MDRKVILIAMTAMCATVVMTSCKSSNQLTAVSVTDKKEMPRQLNVPAEVEVTFPCSGIDSDEEFLRVNGTGNSKDRTMARNRAYQSALANLAAKLEGVMSMENKEVAASTNADGEEFHAKTIAVSKLIAEANVAGYRTSCEKYTVSPQNGSYNCYCTIEFGKQKVVKQLYEALNKDKLLKADFDFERYMKAFEQDLKIYEQKHK